MLGRSRSPTGEELRESRKGSNLVTEYPMLAFNPIDGFYAKKLLEPGWAGELTFAEAEYIRCCAEAALAHPPQEGTTVAGGGKGIS